MNPYRINSNIFKLIQGDITNQTTDIIVNAANTELILGAGVAGAIRRKGGPRIQQECNILAPVRTGEVATTSAGKLPAKYVIHAVGPIFRDYSSTKACNLLKQVVNNSLITLTKYGLREIIFPAISTGIYGFPKQLAAQIMIETIIEFLNQNSPFIVQFCLYSDEDFRIFQTEANQQLQDEIK